MSDRVLQLYIPWSPFYRKHIVYVYKLCAELVPLLYFFVILYVALCSHCTSFHSGCFGPVLLPWELSYQSLAGLSFSYQTCLVKGTCLPDCVYTERVRIKTILTREQIENCQYIISCFLIKTCCICENNYFNNVRLCYNEISIILI